MKKEVLEKLVVLITSAFGLVAALAWNEAVKALFIETFGTPGGNIIALVIYAVTVTLIAVLITVKLGKLTDKK